MAASGGAVVVQDGERLAQVLRSFAEDLGPASALPAQPDEGRADGVGSVRPRQVGKLARQRRGDCVVQLAHHLAASWIGFGNIRVGKDQEVDVPRREPFEIDAGEELRSASPTSRRPAWTAEASSWSRASYSSA